MVSVDIKPNTASVDVKPNTWSLIVTRGLCCTLSQHAVSLDVKPSTWSLWALILTQGVVSVLASPVLIVLMVSVDVKQH